MMNWYPAQISNNKAVLASHPDSSSSVSNQLISGKSIDSVSRSCSRGS